MGGFVETNEPLSKDKIEYKIIIPKEEPKYPIGGYAPGYYECICATCKTKFMGDKYASQCEPCAVEMTKEEPNQIKCYCGHTTMCDCSPLEEPKQEEIDFYAKELMLEKERAYKQQTVEEAAESYARKQCDDMYDDIAPSGGSWGWETSTDFIRGAEWQQERMYSEEDLRKAWEDGRNNVITVGKPPFVITKFQHNSFSNWFKQFKKK